MICSLLDAIEECPWGEMKVIGPNADWPNDKILKAKSNGTYLGFLPPEKAAFEIADADVLLVVMSFEKEYEIFMRTSFTTKFLDYVNFQKPVLIWGPDYCTPANLARLEDSALVVDSKSPLAVLKMIKRLYDEPEKIKYYSEKAKKLSQTVFCPHRLQNIFVDEISKLHLNES